jgi:hypothetical protein
MLQLAFGGVQAVAFCERCNRPLSNPKSVEAHMGPICRGHGPSGDQCQRAEFADDTIEDNLSLTKALVLVREAGETGHQRVLTNVPHLVVHHSPSGFEFGYGGSGPADLALNICQFYLMSIDYHGEKTKCFDGNCFSIAWVLHQEFKRKFIEIAPRDGTTIPWATIAAWFETHITAEMKANYAGWSDDSDLANTGID